MPEITPLEAAEKLEYVYMSCSEKYSRRALDAPRNTDFEYYLQAVRCAVTYLRKIASGEYAPVVHGRWITHFEPDIDWIKYRQECSACHKSINCVSKPFYCENCGAVMDGKDDSHE